MFDDSRRGTLLLCAGICLACLLLDIANFYWIESPWLPGLTAITFATTVLWRYQETIRDNRERIFLSLQIVGYGLILVVTFPIYLTLQAGLMLLLGGVKLITGIVLIFWLINEAFIFLLELLLLLLGKKLPQGEFSFQRNFREAFANAEPPHPTKDQP